MIHLLSSDLSHLESHETLLGQQELPVNILDIENQHVGNSLAVEDLLIIDMDSSHPAIYEIADRFIRTAKGPKVLLTSQSGSQFKPDDTFERDGVFLLFKPYQPQELLNKISIIRSS